MHLPAGNQSQRSNRIDAACTLCMRGEEQNKTESADCGHRPPKVNAAGECRLQIAAETAFFSQPYEQECAGPQCAERVCLRTAKRDATKVNKSNKGQCCHQRGKGSEARCKATQEVNQS